MPAETPRVTDIPVAHRGMFDPPEWTDSDIHALRAFIRTNTGEKFVAWMSNGERALGGPANGAPGERSLGAILGYRAALNAIDSLSVLPEGTPITGEITYGLLPPLDDPIPGETDPDPEIPPES